MSKEFTQDDLNRLVEDATYLQDEAEALKYVIENIPVTQSPPEDTTIAEKLLLLDHLQVNYYRPVFEAVNGQPHRHLKAQGFDKFCNEFSAGEIDDINIQKTLNGIVKHRAALINIFRQIPLIDWEQMIYKDNREIALHDFALDMIRNDRKILKEIAEQVMMFQQDQVARREVKKNIPRRDEQSPENNTN